MTQKPSQHPCMRWESVIYVGSIHILYDTLEGGSPLRSSGRHQGMEVDGSIKRHI